MSNQKVYGPWSKWHGGSGYGAQVIEENGRFALTFWPYCTNCQSPFQFDAEEPFAYCSCGTTEWGDPRPASWVCPPRQPAAQHADDVTVDALRLAAKSAAPYGTAMIGANHLNEAADALDNATKDVAFYMRLAGAFQCEAERYRWIKHYVEKRPLRFQGDGFFADVHSAEALDTLITNSIDLERTVQ